MMRPLLILVIIVLFIVSAYYDLRVGTIPDNNTVYENHELDVNENDEENEDLELMESNEPIPYIEVVVERGQTVYEIVRFINGENNFTEAPHKVIEDFEKLNPNVSAHDIIIGHTYRFPIYNKLE